MTLPLADNGPSRLVAPAAGITFNQVEQQEWLTVKRNFREAACRIFSKTMLEVRTSSSMCILVCSCHNRAHLHPPTTTYVVNMPMQDWPCLSAHFVFCTIMGVL